jgi:hypothetical protein
MLLPHALADDDRPVRSHAPRPHLGQPISRGSRSATPGHSTARYCQPSTSIAPSTGSTASTAPASTAPDRAPDRAALPNLAVFRSSGAAARRRARRQRRLCLGGPPAHAGPQPQDTQAKNGSSVKQARHGATAVCRRPRGRPAQGRRVHDRLGLPPQRSGPRPWLWCSLARGRNDLGT